MIIYRCKWCPACYLDFEEFVKHRRTHRVKKNKKQETSENVEINTSNSESDTSHDRTLEECEIETVSDSTMIYNEASSPDNSGDSSATVSPVAPTKNQILSSENVDEYNTYIQSFHQPSDHSAAMLRDIRDEVEKHIAMIGTCSFAAMKQTLKEPNVISENHGCDVIDLTRNNSEQVELNGNGCSSGYESSSGHSPLCKSDCDSPLDLSLPGEVEKQVATDTFDALKDALQKSNVIDETEVESMQDIQLSGNGNSSGLEIDTEITIYSNETDSEQETEINVDGDSPVLGIDEPDPLEPENDGTQAETDVNGEPQSKKIPRPKFKNATRKRSAWIQPNASETPVRRLRSRLKRKLITEPQKKETPNRDLETATREISPSTKSDAPETETPVSKRHSKLDRKLIPDAHILPKAPVSAKKRWCLRVHGKAARMDTPEPEGTNMEIQTDAATNMEIQTDAGTNMETQTDAATNMETQTDAATNIETQTDTQNTEAPQSEPIACSSKSIIPSGHMISVTRKVVITRRTKESAQPGSLFSMRQSRTTYSLRQRELQQREMMYLQQNDSPEYRQRMMDLEFEKDLKRAMIASAIAAIRGTPSKSKVAVTPKRTGSGRAGKKRVKFAPDTKE